MYYGDYPKSYSKPVCLGERRCLKGPLPIVCLNCFFWNYNYVQSFSIGIFWDYRNCYFLITSVVLVTGHGFIKK